jgi:AraC-like DNA-binding protein
MSRAAAKTGGLRSVVALLPNGQELSYHEGPIVERAYLNLEYRAVVSVRADAHVGLSYRGRQASFGPGMVSLVEPGDVHTLSAPPGNVRFWMLSIPAERAGEILRARMDRPLFSHLVVPATMIPAVALSERIIASPDALEREELLVRWNEQLGTLIERGVVRETTTASLRRARQWIHDHWREEVHLDDLAKAAGASPSQICRSFARAFGVTPHRYLVQVRVHHASELLRRGASADWVAAECGFVDQSHLIRWFRRVRIATPGVYGRTTKRRL